MAQNKAAAKLLNSESLRWLPDDLSPIDRLRASLFEQQRKLMEDRSPKGAALCSRRAGKTQAVIRKMLLTCLEKPRSVAVYFGATLASARKLTWDCPDGLPNLVADIGLTEYILSLNETEHRIDFKNGSVLWIAGCETLADARHWKGLRYDFAACDEAQDWVEEILAYMVNQALAWALMDRVGSQLLLTGTPGPYLGGLFYEVTTGMRKGWSVHQWTCHKNPHLPNVETFIAREIEDRGLQMDDPIVQREFYGRWVRDSVSTLFQYTPGRNDYVDLPLGEEWHHTLGMDVGLRDLATFVLESWRKYDKCVYVQEAYGEAATPKTAPVTRFAEIIRGFQVKFGKGIRLVMDAGALGLGYQLELVNRFGLNVEAAKKTEKASAIRLMNDQLRLGNVKVSPRCKALLDQWQRLQIDPKTQIEKAKQPCDFADAALYGWRDCWAFLEPAEPDRSPTAEQMRMVERVLAAKANGLRDRSLEQERSEMGFRSGYDG